MCGVRASANHGRAGCVLSNKSQMRHKPGFFNQIRGVITGLTALQQKCVSFCYVRDSRKHNSRMHNSRMHDNRDGWTVVTCLKLSQLQVCRTFQHLLKYISSSSASLCSINPLLQNLPNLFIYYKWRGIQQGKSTSAAFDGMRDFS